MKVLQVILLCLLGNSSIFAQSSTNIIQDFLDKNHKGQGLIKSDINNWTITSHHTSKQSGATYVYIRQSHQGIGISNGLANFALKDNKVFSMGNRLIDHISKKVEYTSPSINPLQAIQAAAKELKIEAPKGLKVLEAISTKQFIYNKGNISLENIPVELMYFATQGGDIKLVWDLSIYMLDADHWWSIRIDAQTGKMINKNDWVTHCQFDHSPFSRCNHKSTQKTNNPITILPALYKTMAPDQYTVFALPLESPAHGSRTVVSNPANSTASSFGWHDTNGATGAEYTITRGNNVHAYEDTSNNNSPGFSPDGGASLEFNFPLIPYAHPSTYIPGAITNLFYMNNMLHDIWYQYGFDEASGNFQQNNYGNGGNSGDYVRAETQDGSGTNNANFATPSDGNRPRMQMYIWPFGGSLGSFLTVNTPLNIAASYTATSGSFGPALPAIPLTGDIVLLEDLVAPTADGCESIVNAAQLSGKIVLINQGLCGLDYKVQAAQNAGAIAVIIANTIGFLIPMPGTTGNITIPSIMISQADANVIKSELLLGTVNGSIDNAGLSDKDSDLDNGIIAHEYGHGISNRLVGGASNSGCLHNAEQMGEGWSDWFGLMITMEPGDLGTDIRGIGTYVKGQPNTGPGIRPAPYSTDFAVNNFTYGSSNNVAISQPHGVGFIFATALWDLNWALIDFYGGTFDPDMYNGTGGNNIAMQLIIEGLKLQPCSPGMIDGRDAILQADQLLYGGVHECLIWEVFRKRGFGYSASQGSSASRSDQIEAFDMSPVCLLAIAAPIATFLSDTLNGCVTTIHFQDSSQNSPQQWFWDFGDGHSSTNQNPSHTYVLGGNYTIQLLVTNNIGSDSITQQITLNLPPAPIAIGDEVCSGNPGKLIATGTGDIQWLNIANTVVHNGDTLTINNLSNTQTYYARNIVGTPSQYTGPANASIGTGSYHSSTYHGALNFRADQSLEIVSAWVDADGPGFRTFFLANGTNTDGTTPTSIVDDVTLYLQDGPQRIMLNLMVPDTGDYNIGGSNVDLYRNTNGALFPYTIPSFISINSSSSSSVDNYYYLYDLEVREPRCISPLDTATATPIISAFSYTDTNNTFTFTDGSNGATSWLWYFGDGDSSTLQDPTHTYSTMGTYTVTLSINGGSCISTQIINGLVGIETINNNVPKITLMPNPSSGIATIILNKATLENLTIQVSGMDGRVLQTATLATGAIEFSLNIETLPSAMYIVRIHGSNFSETRKLIKE
jgi:extracellular elastinolytic metalloproteinase